MKTKLTKSHKQYKRRKNVLRRLGFSSYKEYLKSELWKEIRTKILTKNKHTCRYCLGRATQVHHLGYTMSVMSGKILFNLVCVCRECHEKISKISFSMEVGQEEATLIYAKKCPLYKSNRDKKKMI